MRLIRKKEIKFVKLCLISPYLEQTMNILYLISLPIIIFKFLHIPSNMTNYEINQHAKNYFLESKFRNISTPIEYLDYISDILDILYSRKNMPLFIPIGSLRLKRFSTNNNCAIKCFYPNPLNLTENSYCNINTQNLTQENLKECGVSWKLENSRKNSSYYKEYYNQSFYDNFVSNFNGKYSAYLLYGEGEYYDFTYTDLKYNRNELIKFITDTNSKFYLLTFSVYNPHSDTYIHILNGIEMIEYFQQLNHYFTATIFSPFADGDLFLLLTYITFAFSVILTLLKLIYEMNLKLNIVVHLLSLLHELVNIGLIVFITLYISVCREYKLTDELFYNNSYINYLPLIYLREYVIITISFSIFCYPFRVIGFLSWFSNTETLIIYMNIIFRMLPGIVLITLITFGILVSFSLLLYVVYNEYIFGFSNILYSITSIVKCYEINSLYEDRAFRESISITPYYIFYNMTLLLCVFIIIFITISTYVYIFKKSADLEIIKENNETLDKVIELHDKFDKYTNTNNEIANNDSEEQKQLIWLCLCENNNLYNEVCSDSCKILVFTSATQIISFLKYLFAIKPKMQFKNLDKKFMIIIELVTDTINKNYIKEEDIEQIDILFDWLNFAGCKIPINIYTENKLDKYLRMNINANYWNVSFMNTKKELILLFNTKKDFDIKPEYKEPLRSNSILNPHKLHKRESINNIIFKNNTGKRRTNLLNDDILPVLNENSEDEDED